MRNKSHIIQYYGCIYVLDTDFRGVHNDGGYEVKEDVVAVCADTGVTEGHLQLIHGL